MSNKAIDHSITNQSNVPEVLIEETSIKPVSQSILDLKKMKEDCAEKEKQSESLEEDEYVDLVENSQSKIPKANTTDQMKNEKRLKKECETPVLVYSGNDLMNLPEDTTPNLWEPFMCKQGLVALTGSSDVGKSSFLRDLAIAIALKETSFLDHPLNVQHGKVIYYTTEENQSSISSALKKQKDRIGKQDLSGLKYIFSMEDPWKVILGELKASPTDVVMIDCFADIFEGRLNDNGDVRAFLQDINTVCIETGCLFILLHHNGKRTELNAPDKNNIIGSQGFEAKSRLCMDLRKEADGTRTLWFTKGNNIPDSMKKEGLKLKFDENQHFTLIGKSLYVAATVNNKYKFSKVKIMDSVAVIEERCGKLSYDKILVELRKEYGASTPSKGCFVGWMKERKSLEDDDIGQSVAA